MLEPQGTENLAGHEVREVVECLRQLVERGHRRKYDAARFRAQHHVPERRQAHRRFARDNHERALFLQHHVGRAFDQVARETVGDAGERFHRARHNRHGRAPVTAACHRRAEVAIAEQRKGALVHIGAVLRRQIRHQPFDRGRLSELVAKQAAAVVGDDEFHPDAARQELGERADGVKRPARARNGQRNRAMGLTRHTPHPPYTATAKTIRYRMPTYPFRSNARLTCDRSSALTSDCSYTSSPAIRATPSAYQRGSGVTSDSASRHTTVATCISREMVSEAETPNRTGIDRSPCARSKSTSWQAYRTSNPPTQVPMASARIHGSQPPRPPTAS